jgi:hypothetical protein
MMRKSPPVSLPGIMEVCRGAIKDQITKKSIFAFDRGGLSWKSEAHLFFLRDARSDLIGRSRVNSGSH